MRNKYRQSITFKMERASGSAERGKGISPNMALKPTRFRYAPADGLALRYAFQTGRQIVEEAHGVF